VRQRRFRPSGDGVHGTVFLPGQARLRGAVLVIGGSGGSEPSYVAEAVAAEGVAAMSVAYFARPGLPAELREIPLEYFRHAISLLETVLPGGAPVVVIGMSRGSEAALLSAIHFSDLINGIIATVPGNVAAGSWPPGGPAWLLDGRPLPYAAEDDSAGGNLEAVIPAELTRGPILLVSAGEDNVWPSAQMARAIADRLESSGHSFGHQVLEYPDAGHSLGYLVPDLPPGLLSPGIADRPADRTARADAWPRAVQFIGNCLR
jgi:dienelactone hydrolase